MNPVHFQPAPPPPWFPMLLPEPPNSSTFLETRNVRDPLENCKIPSILPTPCMQKELEILMMIKDGSMDLSVSEFLKYLEDRRIDLETQELLSVEEANALMSKLRALLEPFRYVVDEGIPREEKSAVASLTNKIKKSKRNNLWRKRKQKRIAELLAKVVFLGFSLIMNNLIKLTEKLMSGELGRLPRTLRAARYLLCSRLNR
ncbi:hypothetical protein ERO13_A03G093200v2 [Gossypium hirsutum]|nr:hypothetical protein ERO13_A03G093200v2 [Gossypium hirsutum]TYH24746.1 hypothetical protein ES288_A03G115400v1 [Gossypium darwinii]TYH24748.1 hypothetical protein ES288_A03G115400v1 [Gossypium darwinii]TYH24750.1 hypothetical protein ES288_A03G115400v1 [Gossypium darwinii]TYI36026.1 hypothetical protein ES332_A03G114700v1 [Gossypium tomentosum]